MLKKVLFALTLTIALGTLVAPLALAQEETLPAEVKTIIALAAGFGIAIASFGGAIGQARVGTATMEGIARNPGAASAMFVPFILGLALIESLVIYTLIISFILVGKL
ncbi:MAG: ATP synthase F0 subunit C [Thermodesulfobacteriota bacterium]